MGNCDVIRKKEAIEGDQEQICTYLIKVFSVVKIVWSWTRVRLEMWLVYLPQFLKSGTMIKNSKFNWNEEKIEEKLSN